MSEINSENQLRLANIELNRRLVLLEETLREKERTEQALLDSEKRYRRLFESAKDGILILDAETGMVIDVNPFLLELLGYSYEELCGKYLWEIGAFKDVAASKDAFHALQDNEYIRYEDLPLESKAGQSVAVEFVSNVYLVDHSKVIQCNIRDITANKQAKAERKRLMAAIEQMEEAIVITDAQGNIQFVNSAFERMTGYSGSEAVGKNPRILKSGKQDEALYRDLWTTISGGTTWSGRIVNRHKNGTLYTEEVKISPVRDALGQIVNYVSVQRDITDHLQLTAQLQQSQKMEAVGLLAGGIAHDYNNMLTVILGNAELALDTERPTQSLQTNLERIIAAAKHSAEITRKLLAFARKQTIAPVVLDLNLTVQTMLKMLRHLIGENINLIWLPGLGLGQIKMDPVQVDQILANLCINARDAIADVGKVTTDKENATSEEIYCNAKDALVKVGKVTIETGNAVIDEYYCANHPGYVPGDYILLAVSDDGCGMEKEILNQIFDPFFTSKEVGQGTGMGLSTVYGIVKQNQGFINVYSEPGIGTTFKIYLPRCVGQAVEIQPEQPGEMPLGHGETVLLVEDEPALLELGKSMLEKLGYKVLAASTPDEAVRLADEYSSVLHLLVTDVIMPEMNGLDLAECLHSHHPSLKVLFMSGFAAYVLTKQGEHFIQKPFSLRDLAIKVQEASDAEA
ncbi:MAG: PAS domain S-box protein [Desulfobulbaceae bacterium]|nr:PAS domain S-box protein [Desulfobulbaceae bacterium]